MKEDTPPEYMETDEAEQRQETGEAETPTPAVSIRNLFRPRATIE